MILIGYLPYAAPVALVAVAMSSFHRAGRRPAPILLAARIASLLALGLALASMAWVMVQGPASGPLIGFHGMGFSVRLDMLSTIMFTLVAFIGVVVVQFSRNYMDGDSHQGAFIGGLCLTLAAVMLLVISGNLVQFVLAWVLTSLSLHRLLVFYPDRPDAILAARKKFLTARLGDVFLVGAAALMAIGFGTFDIATLADQARAAQVSGSVPAVIPAAAGLLVIAALLKSAQFPTHGWLLEVMETPTPVSALLHAGIINAGGFLIIRFADVMVLSTWSLYFLALIGGFTALFGAVVMLTQVSVKGSLAWSTVAQMGFMLLQCGLGAFPVAVLHIVAHSLYKAHAFLSSGSIVDVAGRARIPAARQSRPGARAVASIGLALVTVVLTGMLFGVSPQHDPAVLAFGAIFILGLGQFLFSAAWLGQGTAMGGWLILRSSGAVAVLAGLYFALQAGTSLVFADLLPGPRPADAVMIAVMLLAVMSFAALTALQMTGPVREGEGWRRAYVHMANGFYANTLFNRLVGSLNRHSASRISKEIA